MTRKFTPVAGYEGSLCGACAPTNTSEQVQTVRRYFSDLPPSGGKSGRPPGAAFRPVSAPKRTQICIGRVRGVCLAR